MGKVKATLWFTAGTLGYTHAVLTATGGGIVCGLASACGIRLGNALSTAVKIQWDLAGKAMEKASNEWDSDECDD